MGFDGLPLPPAFFAEKPMQRLDKADQLCELGDDKQRHRNAGGDHAGAFRQPNDGERYAHECRHPSNDQSNDKSLADNAVVPLDWWHDH